MSVTGFKKQFHKASQLLNEKIIGVEGTKLDDDFIKMEKKAEITHKMILDLISKTTEYLQPNPAYRAKLSMLNTVSRIRGQVNTVGYPQTEGILGDCMLHYGAQLGEESDFGCALTDMGQSLKEMAQVRDNLDINVKHGFIDPLQMMQDKDLKEIAHHLRKLEGRRLDYDYKKRRKGKITDFEIRQAMEKFAESKELAERSMFHLIENDVEQIQHLLGLTQATLDYHRQSYSILCDLKSRLQNRITEASNKPKRDVRSKSVSSTMCYTDIYGFSTCSSAKSSDTEITEALSEKNDCYTHLDQPCCRALYNFTPENQGELGFKEGDIIILTSQIDGNWYEGLLNGEAGFFPINYVEIIIPLPQ